MKLVILDEFGHEGQFIARGDKKYNESPVFGLAGFIVDSQHARALSDRFLELKKTVPRLDKDISTARSKYRAIARGIAKKKSQPIRRVSAKHLNEVTVEVKGSDLFQPNSFSLEDRNSSQRRNTKSFIIKLMQDLDDVGAKLIFCGLEKTYGNPEQTSKKLHMQGLWRCLTIAEKYAAEFQDMYTVVHDQHSAHPEKARRVLQSIAKGPDHKHLLTEPPFQAISSCSHLVQAADWIATLVGRIYTHHARPGEWPESARYPELFEDWLQREALDGSAVKLHPKLSSTSQLHEPAIATAVS